MEKHIKVSYLWQIYGKLLTEKQYNVLDEYYNQDLSLSEIADDSNISRQAVRDLIKKGEEKLFEYEEVLKIMEKTQKNEKTLQLVFSQLSEIAEISSEKRVEKILREVQKELHYIA
ncbi:MAG: putative DNA-binding protein [Clostridia bacterium]|nr:putative DNA-binding protein [Clostridia bacterium]